MDLAACFRWLGTAGFDGPMALDLYQDNYEAVAPRSLEYLRELPWINGATRSRTSIRP